MQLYLNSIKYPASVQAEPHPPSLPLQQCQKQQEIVAGGGNILTTIQSWPLAIFEWKTETNVPATS